MQSVRGRWLACLFVILIGRTASAQGGPPLLTDDPETPGDRQWEINVGITVEQRRFEIGWETPILDLNYGIGKRIQLKYEIPWLIVHRAGEETMSDFGNMLLGVKWRFKDESRHSPAISIYPQIALNPPTGAVTRHLIEGGTDYLVPIQLAQTFGKLAANIEIGRSFSTSGRDSWFGGLAFAREVKLSARKPRFWHAGQKLELLFEVFGEGSPHLDRSESVFNIGARWQVSKNETVLFSIGRGIHSSEHDAPSLIGYLGIQIVR